jgi:hypothetical protein
MQVCGRVEKKPFGTGSKSEHLAVTLVTPERSYVLRRMGGTAFADPELEHLVGQTIRATGEAYDYLFMMTAWEAAVP